MTTAFPGSLDTFPSGATLAGHNLDTDPHSTLHGNLGDAVAALQAKVGVNGSTVTTSHDYKLANLVSTREGLWTYKTTTTMADPGSGSFRANNAAFTASTALAISNLTSGGTDATNVIKALVPGDVIAIQDQSNAANWIRYAVTGAVVNNSTWFQIPVALQTPTSYGGSAPSNNTSCVISFAVSGQGGGSIIGSANDNLLINATGRIDQRSRSGSNLGDDSYAIDRWYTLTQSGNISMATRGSDGLAITQQSATAQRMGLAQIIEQFNIYALRSQTVTLQFDVNTSGSNFTVRAALLEWNGTADAVTSDVVNDWTSSTLTPGNFFISTINTATVTSVAATTSGWTSVNLTVTLNSGINNLIIFFWTDSTVAQSAALNLRYVGLYPGSIVRTYAPRSYSLEELLCRRYCLKLNSYPLGAAAASNSLYGGGPVPFIPAMRVTPTLLSGGSYTGGGTVALDGPTTTSTGFINSANNWTVNGIQKVTCVLDAEL